MGYAKIIQSSNLGKSWLPKDHIHETKLDELEEEKAKRMEVISHNQKKIMDLMCEITKVKHLAKKSPGIRL